LFSPVDELFEERQRVLDDARQLGEVASYFHHPELPVVSSCGARCFFDRASAPDVVPDDEKDAILADAAALKKAAAMFRHPESEVSCEDPTRFGRNYFSRPAAFELDGASMDEGKYSAEFPVIGVVAKCG
jgi:hypothetical protein